MAHVRPSDQLFVRQTMINRENAPFISKIFLLHHHQKSPPTHSYNTCKNSTDSVSIVDLVGTMGNGAAIRRDSNGPKARGRMNHTEVMVGVRIISMNAKNRKEGHGGKMLDIRNSLMEANTLTYLSYSSKGTELASLVYGNPSYSARIINNI